MIKSFRHRGLRQFFETGNARRLPVENAARVRQILQLVDAATYPGALNQPGLFFHPLGKMDPGRYSLRVTGNWRITFAFEGQDAVDVDIEDYH